MHQLIWRALGPTACQVIHSDVVFNCLIDFFDNWPPSPWDPRPPKCAPQRLPWGRWATFGAFWTDSYRRYALNVLHSYRQRITYINIDI